MYKKYISILFLINFFIACKQPNVYEKTIYFNKHEWSVANKPWIQIEVSDTNSLYNILAVVRHEPAFQYNNLILNYTFIAPGDSAITTKINLPLGDNNHWYGDTLGEIVEARIKINKTPQKLKQGKNTFVLEQFMPEPVLKNILNIGIKIEKAE